MHKMAGTESHYADWLEREGRSTPMPDKAQTLVACAEALRKAACLKAALAELVELKRMKERIEAHDFSSEGEAAHAASEYARRKPLAWAAASALLEE